MAVSQKDTSFKHEDHWFRLRAGALIVEDGYALFAFADKIGHLYTVGGGIRMGEHAEDCVRREAFEETGVPYEPDRLAAVVENFFIGHGGNLEGADCHAVELYYLMKPRGSRSICGHSVLWDGSPEQVVWVPLDRLEEYDIRPAFLKERLP